MSIQINKFYKILPIINGLKFCDSIKEKDFIALKEISKKLSMPSSNIDDVIRGFVEIKNRAVMEGDKEAEKLINTAIKMLKGE